MTLVLTPVDDWFDGQRYHSVGTILASANYATGGELVIFSQAKVKASKVPDWVEIHGMAGYVYGYNPGATIDLGRMLAFEAGADAAPLDQVPASTMPAALIADIIRYHAIFKMG